MEFLRDRDRHVTSWKNGGGVTREVAAFPPGALIDAFGWRISIADVEVAGSFSCFEGVDRILTVLHGLLRLTDADGATVDVLAGDPPYAFPGDAPISGRPLGGTVRDLNVMVRRGQWRTVVKRCEAGRPVEAPILADAMILVAQEFSVVEIAGHPAITLDTLDAIRLSATGGDIRVDSGLVYLISLFRI